MHLLVIAVSVLATAASAQTSPAPPPPTGAYVTTSAKGDTFAVETFNRTRNEVVGEIHIHSIRQRLAYTLVLGEGDIVTRLDAAVRPDTASPTSTPLQSFSASFHDDSVLLQVPAGSRSIPTRAGTLPWVNPSFSMLEQIIRRAHRIDPPRAHADSVPVFDLNSGPIVVSVSWALPDSAVVAFPNTSARVALDGDHVIGVRLPDGTVVHAHQLQH
jgi:hypothetical protein